MSDALSYLVKARPEAMGHYFAFLKDCGRHLDPKTRALISLITKVHAQTERGFRQYLSRALREGCTPAEVLDALLMAFPALGLAKIVWAVDIILALGLPNFEPRSVRRASGTTCSRRRAFRSARRGASNATAATVRSSGWISSRRWRTGYPHSRSQAQR
jgi:alkylhydroperoxidase/carboxymuconolactone decarboxylase family protein YurZ